jgi:uncharacterized protein YndB with AHSA1/START domain
MSNAIVLAITCDLDRKRLWRLFADPVERARWWAPDIVFEMEVGGRFSDSYPDDGGGRLETHGEVLELDPASRFVFSWRESLWPEGQVSRVSLDFSGDEGATRVELIHEPMPGFDDMLWARVRTDFLGGWFSLLLSLRDHVHRGRFPSRHDVVIEKRLETPLEEAFGCWTSERLLTEWLCDRAGVELCQGGGFELFWNGDSQEESTAGCSVVQVEIPHRLMAQWRGPSYLSLMGRPGTTVINVSFSRAGKQTAVRLEHMGFGVGPEWSAARDWQKMAWQRAFERLE